MAFTAKTFILDSIPSETMNIYLGEFDGDGFSSNSTSSSVEPLTQHLFRKAIPLFWGAEQLPILSFPLSMYSPAEISAQDFSQISAWLYGAMNYAELRICQPDMFDTYFNVFLTDPYIVRIGNIIRGTTCTVICNAPWGFKQPKTHTYNYDHNEYSITDNISFLNMSANNFYTYPTNLVITANMFGGSISIVNTSDASRTFTLTLLADEVVTIDCDKQIMSSTLVTYPLSGFNKNFLRFIRGTNDLVVTGNIAHLGITYPVAVKISG